MGDLLDHTRLHRTAKYFMDSGRAETPEEALALLKGFGLSVVVAPSVAASVEEQIALLSLVNAGRRTFLGGVEVTGIPEATLHVPLASASALKDAVVELGGRIADTANPHLPTALIGQATAPAGKAPRWRLTWAGWRGGVVPARMAPLASRGPVMPLAPALAAAVCAAEVFAYHAGDHSMAGHRSAGLSLWAPGRDWLLIVIIVLLAVPLQVSLIPIAKLYGDVGLFGSVAGVILFHTAYGLPFAIFLLRNFFTQIPGEMLEAARIDGAGDWRIFGRIILPLGLPAIASLSIFQFLWTWNDMLVALIFTNATSQPVTVAIQSQLRQFGANIDILSAGAFLSMILPLIVFFAFQRYFVSALLAGSTK